MIGSLAKNSPGEICQEILDHEQEVVGLVTFAFLSPTEMTWGMTGDVPPAGLVEAINLMMAELHKMNHLAAMPPEGRA